MPQYADFHQRSIAERDAFWAEQARLIDWHTPRRMNGGPSTSSLTVASRTIA